MKQPITVCLGFGVDSVAMLIEMHRRGIRPDLISFGDTGGEKAGTYAFIPVFQQWLADHDFPAATICEYKPKVETAARYRQSVIEVADKLGISLDDTEIARLSRLYGNMVANNTLPGIAFGPKSCSMKWKLEAQEPT